MRAWIVVVIATSACSGKKQEAAPASGSAAPPKVTESPVAETPPVTADDATCSLDGNYRLRFHSNGVDGWWLRLAVTGKDVKITGKTTMLGLDEPGAPTINVDDKACTITIAKQTKQAGDLKIDLSVANTKVTGTVTRTSKHDKPSTPITGVRETSPEPTGCIKPGRYTLAITNVKKWNVEGEPRDETCEENAELHVPMIRVELLGGELLIDEASSSEPFDQAFGRATVKRTGECEADIALSVQDFKLAKAHVTFAGDTFTGTTTEYTFETFEDGDAGENMWSCSTTQGDVIGKRVGD